MSESIPVKIVHRYLKPQSQRSPRNSRVPCNIQPDRPITNMLKLRNLINRPTDEMVDFAFGLISLRVFQLFLHALCLFCLCGFDNIIEDFQFVSGVAPYHGLVRLVKGLDCFGPEV
ncbi:hypothetical protein BJX76DRAFT_329596 [Aspergillus varians]